MEKYSYFSFNIVGSIVGSHAYAQENSWNSSEDKMCTEF